MRERSLLCAMTLAAALAAANAGAQPADQPRFPDLKGQWVRVGGLHYDPSKAEGSKQQAPLTAEYQARYQAGVRRAAAGGPPSDPQLACFPAGMPRVMIGAEPMEILPTPKATYIVISYMNEFRMIHTDGRDWPQIIEPSFTGYSIGKWLAGDDGRYDSLTIETRGLKGPRTFDASGVPLHDDNETVVKERIYLDPGDLDVLHDEITTIDHALTRPWSVIRSYHRQRNPTWTEHVCAQDGRHILIGTETYLLSEDGYLMPAYKGQPAPDLSLFKQSSK